ncbi:MAG: phosphoribosyltransferase [Candidatus Sungbacteria bacterium]|nr:phosphoribosyltransferase [Candidatus Sungbacteria bacterium]
MSVQLIPRRHYTGQRQLYVLHRWDGIASALDPIEFHQVIKSLVARIPAPYDYVVSLDGPALPASTLISQISGKPLQVAVKADLELPLQIMVAEPGSPNPIFFYNLTPGRVILVDDEIRTGRTVIGCIEALAAHNVIVVAVIVPIGSTKFGIATQFQAKNIPLIVHQWYDI